MIPVSEAQQLVLEHARPLAAETVPLGPEALGRVLAEAVISDLDMPPYDKSMMDGYVVRSADLSTGTATLEIVEEVMAGHMPTRPVGAGQASRLMTGAAIPEGADAVVMVERTRQESANRVRIEDKPAKPGQHILARGREMRAGETILTPGTRLTPQEFGLLAAVGRSSVRVHPAPRVNILATGDEIVDPAVKPGPGQIRNSNGAMLLAQACRAGAQPRLIGIAGDNPDSLTKYIKEGLSSDVLLLSGGVSAGKADLVPDVLQALGVSEHFHKVRMKPGKPVFFGTSGPALVFGLPGNPVSSLVCFELFVRPALRRLMNISPTLPPVLRGMLEQDFAYKTDRPTYHPAQARWHKGQYRLRIVPWFGSAHLRALAGTNAFALIGEGEHKLKSGQEMEVLPVDYS